MPIPKHLRPYYRGEWLTRIRPSILEREGHCCALCGKPDRLRVLTLPGGVWLDLSLRLPHIWQCWRAPGSVIVIGLPPEARGIHRLDGPRDTITGGRPISVLLGVAHLNQIPGDDRPENLAALCGYCHLTHDREQHANSRRVRKDRARPLLASLV